MILFIILPAAAVLIVVIAYIMAGRMDPEDGYDIATIIPTPPIPGNEYDITEAEAMRAFIQSRGLEKEYDYFLWDHDMYRSPRIRFSNYEGGFIRE